MRGEGDREWERAVRSLQWLCVASLSNSCCRGTQDRYSGSREDQTYTRMISDFKGWISENVPKKNLPPFKSKFNPAHHNGAQLLARAKSWIVCTPCFGSAALRWCSNVAKGAYKFVTLTKHRVVVMIGGVWAAWWGLGGWKEEDILRTNPPARSNLLQSIS